MKIILVGPVYPYRGGIAHYTQCLDQALQDCGHTSQVISFRRQYPGWLYPGQSDRDPSQKEKPANAHYLLDPLYPWTWRQAARQMCAAQPDLAVIQWWTTFWSVPFAYLARALKRQGIPALYLIHNALPHEPRPWDAPLARLALSAGAAFLAQTGQEKDRLLRLIPNAQVHVYAHPAYPIGERQGLSRAEARKQLGLPGDQPVLLFFGLVRAYKGLGDLIAALGMLRQQGLRPHLLVAGEFWEDKNQYLRQIEALEITQQVHIDDRYIPDEEVEKYFAAANLLIAPYTQGATQSGAANMARGFGLAMVVTDEVARGLGQTPPGLVSVTAAGDIPALAAAIKARLESGEAPAAQPVSAREEWRLFAQNLAGIIHTL